MTSASGGEQFPLLACDEVAWQLRGLLGRRVGATALYVTDEPGVLMVLSGYVATPRNATEQSEVEGAKVEIVVRSSLSRNETIASVALRGVGHDIDREYILEDDIPSPEGLSNDTAEQDDFLHEALELFTPEAEATYDLADRVS